MIKKILVFFLICLCFENKVFSSVKKVGANEEHKSIREAIRVANSGDTIEVSKNIYKEKNIIIDKPVTLIGIDFPVIDGENKYENITVISSNVKIIGFKIINSGSSSIEDFAAIKISGARNVIVQNNILENNFFGIYTEASVDCKIENNVISSNAVSENTSGNGIHCWKSDSLVIVNNKISKHRDGIYFEFVGGSIITRNIATENIRYGLHFMFSNNDAYIQNYFAKNGSGVAVMYSKKVSMIYNFFEKNWGDASYGLLLKEISDSHIESNYFQENTTAVVMEGTSRLLFEYNRFKNNGWGLRIQASCMDTEITKNNFINNTFDISTNGSLVLNTFNYNYWDKYEGYDLNKDKIGDVPFRPLSLFSVIVEINPSAMLLYKSFMVSLLEKSEKIIPSITPDNFVDNFPVLTPYKI